MAPPRSFDYDVLNQVMLDRPELESQQLADILTDYERFHCRQGIHWLRGKQCGSPDYPVIQPNSISRVVSQMRAVWEDEDRPVRDRPYGRLLPWPGLPFESAMSTPMRHLKTLARSELGQTVTEQAKRQALNFKARLEAKKTLIDIDDDGMPLERPARPDELDSSGSLLRLYAE